MLKFLGAALAAVKIGCEIHDMIDSRNKKRQYDVTPFTTEQIQRIRELHNSVQDHNKRNPDNPMTQLQFKRQLNYEFGMDKSIRSYIRIANGVDIPKQYLETSYEKPRRH